MTIPRIIFLDVDGTILGHGSSVSDSTVSAIRSARANGHLVFICTGRSANDIPVPVRAIGFDGAVTNGGAYATWGTELIVSHPMPREATQRLITYFDANRLEHLLEAHHGVFGTPKARELVEKYFGRTRDIEDEELRRLGLLDTPDALGTRRYRDRDEADLDQVAKAVFASDDPHALTRAREDLGDQFLVIPGSIPLPVGSNGEVSLHGTNKGAAIVEVLSHLGIDASDAVGIGDSWNDVLMFEVCGVSIAMGGADPALQALADRVTTGVLDDGVHNALTELGLASTALPGA